MTLWIVDPHRLLPKDAPAHSIGRITGSGLFFGAGRQHCWRYGSELVDALRARDPRIGSALAAWQNGNARLGEARDHFCGGATVRPAPARAFDK